MRILVLVIGFCISYVVARTEVYPADDVQLLDEMHDALKNDRWKDDPGRVVERVRETIYSYPTPLSHLPPPPSATTPVPLLTAPPSTNTSAGNISSFKPVFTFLIHHPLRAIYSYAIPWLLKYIYITLAAMFRLLGASLRTMLPLLTPLRMAIHILFTPARVASRLFMALMPLWIVLVTATALGSVLGYALSWAFRGSTRSSRISSPGGRRRRGASPVIEKEVFGQGARLEKLDKGKQKVGMDMGNEREWRGARSLGSQTSTSEDYLVDSSEESSRHREDSDTDDTAIRESRGGDLHRGRR